MEAESRGISEIRADLVPVRIALRTAHETLALAKAQAELRVIEAAGGEKALGANAEARERALLVALAADPEYAAEAGRVRNLLEAADRLEAEMADATDRRREWEWAVRSRLADALDRRGIVTDQMQPNGDHAFDSAATEAATAGVVSGLEDDDTDPFS